MLISLNIWRRQPKVRTCLLYTSNNEALTALKWFGIEASAAGDNGIGYNDVVRWIYDEMCIRDRIC